MSSLFAVLIDIVLLRRGPQDLPAGRSVLLACLFLYVLVAALSLNIGRTPDNATAILILAAGLPLLIVRVVLHLRRRINRWEQTLSALYGSSALLSLITLPFGLDTGDEPSQAALVISLLVFFWSFMVDAHIWRHALDASFAAGLFVAVLVFIFTFGIISGLAGPL